ncbi:MAG: HNH endonuclease [Phocaeicola sp.]
MNPKYRFYATLLDAYHGYLHSDVIWEKYWGFAEEPPHTPEEFHELQRLELIDRINRKPFDSEAADKGTAFNEVIDCMIDGVKSDKVHVERVYDNYILCDECCTEKNCDYSFGSHERCKSVKKPNRAIKALKATYNNREFTFPISFCRKFADYFKGALTQQRVEAILPTKYGGVLVYGFIDELMPTSVHDIKTTGKYSAFKFKDHFQHLVYPYCLLQNGNDIRVFEYNITDFKEMYTEVYVFDEERGIPILQAHCESFIEFLEEHRELITDKKIFNQEDHGQ